MDVRQIYHPVMRQLALTYGNNSSSIFSETDDTDLNNNNDDDDESPVTTSSMTNNIVQSDMDIVCIGTASCTPGITRGVSCTAIRCNWNRRSTSPGISTTTTITGTVTTSTTECNNHQNDASPSTAEATTTTSQSGTWIFDVGECTQVCTR